MRFNKLKIKTSQEGLSLIELIIYIALTGTITLAFISLSVTISNSSIRTETGREVNYNSQIIFDNLNDDLNKAKSIDTTRTIFDSDEGRLVFQNYLDETIEYIFENGRLKKSIDGNPAVDLISNDVEIEHFQIRNTSTNNYNVSIDYTVKYYNPGKKPELDYSQNIRTSFTLLIYE